MEPNALRVWPMRQAVARGLADVLATLAAFATAFVIAEHARAEPSAAGLVVLLGLLLSALVVVVFAKGGLYRPRITVLNLLELRSVLRMAFVAGTMFLAVALVTGLFDGRRWVLALATSATLPALLVERRVMAVLRAKGHWLNGSGERTLVYGYNEAARLLMKKIVQAPQAGRTLVGFVDDFVMYGTEVAFRVDRNGSPPFVAQLLGRTADLPDIIREHRVTEVLISSPGFEPEVLARLGDKKAELGVHWGIAAQFGRARPDELVAEDVGAIPVLYPATLDASWSYLTAKRVLDVCVALGAILLTWPAWLVIAAAIRIESGSPVLFRQERVGKDRRPFVMLKFRSLRTDAEPYQSSTSLPEDKVTRVGRILRATTLDEVPQLLNVLIGDISLVGPRPEMPFLVAQYNDVQARRLSVKPGITGVWQLSPDRHGMEIHENIEFDLFYIAHRSFTMDSAILFETVVFTTSAIVRALFHGRDTLKKASTASRILTYGTSGYVLVALDQRRVDRSQADWVQLVALLGEERPVVVLASRHNVGAFRSALSETPWCETLRHRLELVPYRSRADFMVLLTNANSVVTDVPEFSEMAMEAGIEVLRLPGGAATSGQIETLRRHWSHPNPARSSL